MLVGLCPPSIRRTKEGVVLVGRSFRGFEIWEWLHYALLRSSSRRRAQKRGKEGTRHESERRRAPGMVTPGDGSVDE